jgi:hypothetical protein
LGTTIVTSIPTVNLHKFRRFDICRTCQIKTPYYSLELAGPEREFEYLF